RSSRNIFASTPYRKELPEFGKDCSQRCWDPLAVCLEIQGKLKQRSEAGTEGGRDYVLHRMWGSAECNWPVCAMCNTGDGRSNSKHLVCGACRFRPGCRRSPSHRNGEGGFEGRHSSHQDFRNESRRRPAISVS